MAEKTKVGIGTLCQFCGDYMFNPLERKDIAKALDAIEGWDWRISENERIIVVLDNKTEDYRDYVFMKDASKGEKEAELLFIDLLNSRIILKATYSDGEVVLT